MTLLACFGKMSNNCPTSLSCCVSCDGNFRKSETAIYTPRQSLTSNGRVFISFIYMGCHGININLAVKSGSRRSIPFIIMAYGMIEFPKWGYSIFGGSMEVKRVENRSLESGGWVIRGP